METYAITGTKAYLEFDDKDPEAVNEYLIDFSQVLEDGVSLEGQPEVEIEAAGNAETPLELTVQAVSLSPVAPSGPDLGIRFFLGAGTAGSRYRGKIKCTQTSTTSGGPQRSMVKRFYIVVQGQ
jgi:hypothetical protein